MRSYEVRMDMQDGSGPGEWMRKGDPSPLLKDLLDREYEYSHATTISLTYSTHTCEWRVAP